jgi:nicotinate-nucleotide adenylyltransferase
MHTSPTGDQGEIALLGGSFNPPHVAHLMAAYWALATQSVSEVWLLPAFRHPFGKALAPFEQRVEMCRLAAAELRRVAVCTEEADLAGHPLAGKTAFTLEHLVDRYPGQRFALVVGADILSETSKWYRFDRVRELARLIVVGRSGFTPKEGAPELPEISSTSIREKLQRGEDVSPLVPASVLRYIREKGLYR